LLGCGGLLFSVHGATEICGSLGGLTQPRHSGLRSVAPRRYAPVQNTYKPSVFFKDEAGNLPLHCTGGGLTSFLSVHASCHFLLRKWFKLKSQLRRWHCRFAFGPEDKEQFRIYMRMMENFSGCRVLAY